jgi:hypothetical protein
MNDVESLREAYIADEIIRLENLSRQELLQELIDLNAERLESLSFKELIT